MKSNFNSCPVCREQCDQCLHCASYVVDGERIYYEKLKDFGAIKDHEVRFINRIQKHRTTAFFHNGKLYIPSRQGRSVPLAIGLQWEAWQEQQSEIDQLKAQLSLQRDRNKALEAELTSSRNYGDQLKAEKAGLEKRVEVALNFANFSSEISIGAFVELNKILRGEHD